MVYILAPLFGLVVGSFMNVFILRYGTGRGVGGRSKCFSCGHTLSSADLVPLFSYIFLRGRCRYCKSRISPQYFVVELFSALILLAVAYAIRADLFFGWQQLLMLVFASGFFLCLLAISVYDMRHKMIPDGMLLGAGVFALANFAVVTSLLGSDNLLLTIVFRLLSGVALALPFFLVWFFSKGRWMGFADWKLAFVVGLFLGFDIGLSAVILAFWIGAFTAVSFIFLGRFDWFGRIMPFISGLSGKSEMPFGPFLAIGAFLAYYFAIMYGDILNLFIII